MLQTTTIKPQWDTQRVKDELPNLCVMLGGELFTGQIKGRKLEHPKVVVNCGCKWCKAGIFHEFEYSWVTLAQVLNDRAGIVRV